MQQKKIFIETERLLLRQWREADFLPFAALNRDTEVMAFFPRKLSRKESFAMIEQCQALLAVKGFGLFAVERKDTSEFIGFTGLNEPAGLPVSPCTEIAWRLDRKHWGQGFATEAATACLDLAFLNLGLNEVLSFTTLQNHRSQRVMEKIGMHRRKDTFEHPAIEPGNHLKTHCVYIANRSEWCLVTKGTR